MNMTLSSEGAIHKTEKLERVENPSLDEQTRVNTKDPPSFLDSLLVQRPDAVSSQFVRYLVTGGVALAADFATLYLLTRLAGLHYMMSAVVAFMVGLVINYALSSRWVFAQRSVRNRALEFGIFAAVGVVGLGLNEAGLWLLSGKGGAQYLRAKAMTTAVVFLWNFGARKVALFR